MTDDMERATCRRNCWLIGGGIGLVLAFLLAVWGALGFLTSLVVGIVIAVVATLVLRSMMCSGSTAASSAPARTSAPATAGSAAAVSGATPAAQPRDAKEGKADSVTPSELKKDLPADEPQPEVAVVPPGSEAAGTEAEKEEAASGRNDKDPGGANVSTGGEAEESEADDHDAAVEDAVTPSELKDGLPGDAPVPEVATLPPGAESDKGADATPRLYDAPPAEGADDLKRISGVGPKMEETLNGLGIYCFEQIADWGPSDVAWVDERLRFKGRIDRDDWIGQARTLADGGAPGAAPAEAKS
jgi:predicted flap endonuclease-1-like 5' DNA nuclease